MISFTCSSCSKPLQVKDEMAGKKAKCPGCGQVISIPTPSATLGGTVAQPASRPQPASASDHTQQYQPAAPQPATEPRTLPPSKPAADSIAGATQGVARSSSGHPAELTEFLAPAQTPDELGRLGPYRVLAVLGHGGMGVVFRAQDPHLERLVALKAMLPSLASTPSAKERFFREAKAAAALKHPHVVTIHQIGEDRGAPFLAMEFLEGEPLDDRIKREGRLPIAEIARIGREVALGLAAAHERGLIHRDIKPANIWLEGKAGHVKILDFGLARALSDQQHLTQSGMIVGTPSYMAPEQAMGKPVDGRCDLFSLGCVLYRMCTGELPFKGNDTLAILSALALETPKPPHEVNSQVPQDLSDLVMQLLAKQPENRPQSAQEVVEALAPLAVEQTAEMVRPRLPARPRSSPAVRTSGAKGRRLAVATAGVVLLGLVLEAVYWLRPKGGPAEPTPAQQPEEGPPPAMGVAAWEPGPAEDVLPGLVARPATIDGLRRWQVETVALRSQPHCLAWSSDGKLLAVGMASGEIRVYQGGTLRPVRFLYGHEGEIKSLSWTKGGRLASASVDRTVRLWEPDGTPGPVVRESGPVFAVAWRPDGTLLASGTDKLVRLWQPDGTPHRVLSGHQGGVISLSWSTDGQRLASTGDNTVRVWDPEGRPGLVLDAATVLGDAKGRFNCVSWSPDGQRLAMGSPSATVHVWSANGQAGPKVKLNGSVTSVSWSPDGARIVVAELGGGVRLWSPEGNSAPVVIQAWRDPNISKTHCFAACDPDGKTIASCTETGFRLWDAQGQPGPELGLVHSGPTVAWSPDGQRLASGGRDRLVRLWGADGKPGPVLEGHKWPVESVSWSPDGRRLASGGDLRIWEADGKEVREVPGGQGPIAWSPDGQLLASRIGGAPGGLRLWDARTLTQQGPNIGGPGCGTSPTWSPDSQRIAMAGVADHYLALIRRDGKLERSIRGRHLWCVSWSPDGRHIALGTEGGTELWTSAGELGASFKGGHVLALSWAPDSQRLAAGNGDGSVLIRGVDGKAGPVLPLRDGIVSSLSWSRKGNRLAASSDGGTIRVFETEGMQPLWTAVVLPSRQEAVFSAAGQILHGRPTTADEHFVYVAQTEAGRYELYTPSEFQNKALKGGQPLPLFRPDAAPVSRAVDDAWIKQVRGQPLAQQRDEILARLRELNPGHFEPFQHKQTNGTIVAVTLPASLELRDLSPLRALDALEQLTINGPDKGARLPLADLKPLAGLKLKEFACTGTNVADLTPLASMPLEKLTLRNVAVADLRPLRALPLKALIVRDSLLSDLTPLRSIASLESLDVRGSRVTDLKPVQGMLLKEIGCDVEPKRDAPVLRAMPTLTRINDLDARVFLQRPVIRLALEKWLQDVTALPPEKWLETVVALPADRQLLAVETKLWERNPTFDQPAWGHEIKDGAVVGIWVHSDLSDFSPLHALTGLRTLHCENEASRGKLTDLSFVKGMKLTSLHCNENRGLTDFTPLEGMPLTDLDCFATGLADLTVLKDMPLTSLRCGLTRVTDLTPLRGMKLTRLDCSRMGIKDLAPLQGMPLTYLACYETQVTDLSPLKGMPLEWIKCDFEPERDAAILREIKTLKTINDKPAAQFWKEVDAKK